MQDIVANSRPSRPLPGVSTLVELLQVRADYTRDCVGFIWLDEAGRREELTYGDLDLRAPALAAELQSRKLEGQRALLMYPPGIKYLIAFFGCLYAGVIAVPAYPPGKGKSQRWLHRIEGMVQNCTPIISLGEKEVLSDMRESGLCGQIGHLID